MQRALTVAVAIAVVAVVSAFAVDRLGLVGGLGPGSLGLPLGVIGLEELPADPECDPDAFDAEPCQRRFAFAPDGSVVAWVSVRNEGPLPLTLHGVRQAWIDGYADRDPLARPTRGFDGGEMLAVAANGPRRDPSADLTLGPGDERVLGVELTTTSDAARACEMWEEGGGVVWDVAPIEWSWLLARHEHNARFDAPLTFMAPTAADCDS